jgi:hypothetical protein
MPEITQVQILVTKHPISNTGSGISIRQICWYGKPLQTLLINSLSAGIVSILGLCKEIVRSWVTSLITNYMELSTTREVTR